MEIPLETTEMPAPSSLGYLTEAMVAARVEMPVVNPATRTVATLD